MSAMFDKEALQEPDHPAPAALPFAELTIEQLLDLRTQIDAHLPPVKLEEMDLVTEVGLQYQRTKALYSEVAKSLSIPANQKAQCANSVASVLDQLVKMQAKLFDAERVKAIEQALIKALKTLPKEAQAVFFDHYEQIYQGGS